MEREIAACKFRRKHNDPTGRGFGHRSQLSIFNLSRRSLRGFTLVELLIVITIIGFLMAFIIPGVNALREQGRQTACLNNQMQISKAMFSYEGAQNRLPGVLNQTSGTSATAAAIQYNWAEALFPYLDRTDMWNAVCTGGTVQNQMNVMVLVCPNDPYLVDPTSTNYRAILSYGVNGSIFVSYLSNPPVNISGTQVAPPLLSKIANPSTTIMLGERTGDGSSTYPRAGNATYPTAGPWTIVAPSATAWPALAFQWPTTQTMLSPGIMVSAHPGKVIAVFFDGHGDKVNSNTNYP